MSITQVMSKNGELKLVTTDRFHDGGISSRGTLKKLRDRQPIGQPAVNHPFDKVQERPRPEAVIVPGEMTEPDCSCTIGQIGS